MLEIMVTLLRGKAARIEETLADRNAMTVLEQQFRDASAEVDTSRKALALAIAQDETEARRAARIEDRIRDLEDRATAALNGGREDLAAEAAETIATLEGDLSAIREARAGFAVELKRLRTAAAAATRRLSALDRGRRLAAASESVARLRATRARSAGPGALAQAEATLARLRSRQAEETAADAALAESDTTLGPEALSEKLEAEGFGPATRVTASAVLDRLRERTRSGTEPG